MADKTHYDILKVTQDAPEEVIAAAYKALARKYHPDKAGDSLEAMRVMQEINISYQILSDPHKRNEHDLWIAQQQAGARSADSAVEAASRKAPPGKTPAGSESLAEANKWKAWAAKTAQEAKEAQERADKALADLAKAKASDRAKWEAWVEKTARDAKETKERAEKAAAQAAKYVEEALKAHAGSDGV